MATYATANAIGQREDLSDVIYRIDPDETPVFSNAQKEVTKVRNDMAISSQAIYTAIEGSETT